MPIWVKAGEGPRDSMLTGIRFAIIVGAIIDIEF
jgi:hypothetical protein